MGIKTNEFPPRFCPLSLTPNITMKNSNESARLCPLYLKLSQESHLRIANASPEQEGIAVRGHSDLLKGYREKYDSAQYGYKWHFLSKFILIVRITVAAIHCRCCIPSFLSVALSKRREVVSSSAMSIIIIDLGLARINRLGLSQIGNTGTCTNVIGCKLLHLAISVF